MNEFSWESQRGSKCKRTLNYQRCFCCGGAGAILYKLLQRHTYNAQPTGERLPLTDIFQPIFVNFCCYSVKNSLDKILFSVFLTKIICNITGSKSLNREVEYFLWIEQKSEANKHRVRWLENSKPQWWNSALLQSRLQLENHGLLTLSANDIPRSPWMYLRLFITHPGRHFKVIKTQFAPNMEIN